MKLQPASFHHLTFQMCRQGDMYDSNVRCLANKVLHTCFSFLFFEITLKLIKHHLSLVFCFLSCSTARKICYIAEGVEKVGHTTIKVARSTERLQSMPSCGSLVCYMWQPCMLWFLKLALLVGDRWHTVSFSFRCSLLHVSNSSMPRNRALKQPVQDDEQREHPFPFFFFFFFPPRESRRGRTERKSTTLGVLDTQSSLCQKY